MPKAAPFHAHAACSVFVRRQFTIARICASAGVSRFSSVGVLLIGEVYNLHNAANLTGFSGDLTSAAFGQPTGRATQVFGSGGPRVSIGNENKSSDERNE